MKLEHWRPNYDGRQRDGDYPFVLWRDLYGVTHEANLYSNQTLCELWLASPRRLVVEVERPAPPGSVVTCMACVSWAALQEQVNPRHMARRREKARAARHVPGRDCPPRRAGSP